MKYPEFLQPLPIPTQAWRDISMDFIQGLPKLEGKEVILVVIDCFSKYGHFIALTYPSTSPSVAKIFMGQIFRLHDMPHSIVSNKDKAFISLF